MAICHVSGEGSSNFRGTTEDLCKDVRSSCQVTRQMCCCVAPFCGRQYVVSEVQEHWWGKLKTCLHKYTKLGREYLPSNSLVAWHCFADDNMSCQGLEGIDEENWKLLFRSIHGPGEDNLPHNGFVAWHRFADVDMSCQRLKAVWQRLLYSKCKAAKTSECRIIKKK